MDNTQNNTVKMAKTPVEVINAVLQYLGARPYSEVANLIHALNQSQICSNNECEKTLPKKEDE